MLQILNGDGPPYAVINNPTFLRSSLPHLLSRVSLTAYRLSLQGQAERCGGFQRRRALRLETVVEMLFECGGGDNRGRTTGPAAWASEHSQM